MQDTDVMVSIGGRSWRFSGAEIDLRSEFERRGDGRLYLHDGVGNVVEDRELSEVEVEQLSRETLLADVFGACGCEAAIRGRLGRRRDQEMCSMRSSSGWSPSVV